MPNEDSEARGCTPDRLMRDALIYELNQDGQSPDGQFDIKIRLVARVLVDKAVDGDAASIKEIFDRIDGRATTAAESAPQHGLTFEEALDQLTPPRRPFVPAGAADRECDLG